MKAPILAISLLLPAAGVCGSLEEAKVASGAAFGEGQVVPAIGVDAVALAAAPTAAPVIAAKAAAVPAPSLPTRRREWPKEENRWSKLGAGLGGIASAAVLIAVMPATGDILRVLLACGVAATFISMMGISRKVRKQPYDPFELGVSLIIGGIAGMATCPGSAAPISGQLLVGTAPYLAIGAVVTALVGRHLSLYIEAQYARRVIPQIKFMFLRACLMSALPLSAVLYEAGQKFGRWLDRR